MFSRLVLLGSLITEAELITSSRKTAFNKASKEFKKASANAPNQTKQKKIVNSQTKTT
jgi:hypothetical protein